jgi:4'-phosphopantetheinyl transferase
VKLRLSQVVVRHDTGGRLGPRGRLLIDTAASLWQCSPDDVRVTRTCVRCGGAHGRPRLLGPGRRALWGSVAHSETMTIVAIGRRPIGIDLEEGAGDELRTWVRKEAALKATGDGLAVDPDRLELGPAGAPPHVVRWHLAARRPPVRLADIELGPGRVAALAVIGRRLPDVDAAASAGELGQCRLA